MSHKAGTGTTDSTRRGGARTALRGVLAAAGALTLTATLTACAGATNPSGTTNSSSATSSSSTAEAAEAAATVSADARIIDVRTPAEFAEGHLDGAELLDLTGGDFAAALPSLDPDDEYGVYCRSGNRSAQAVQLMMDAGFSNVTDLGSVDEAADATGIAVVQVAR